MEIVHSNQNYVKYVKYPQGIVAIKFIEGRWSCFFALKTCIASLLCKITMPVKQHLSMCNRCLAKHIPLRWNKLNIRCSFGLANFTLRRQYEDKALNFDSEYESSVYGNLRNRDFSFHKSSDRVNNFYKYNSSNQRTCR